MKLNDEPYKNTILSVNASQQALLNGLVFSFGLVLCLLVFSCGQGFSYGLVGAQGWKSLPMASVDIWFCILSNLLGLFIFNLHFNKRPVCSYLKNAIDARTISKGNWC